MLFVVVRCLLSFVVVCRCFCFVVVAAAVLVIAVDVVCCRLLLFVVSLFA